MKILFICPNWAKLATPIVNEMTNQGHDVVHIDHSDLSRFTYFDNIHRLFSKLYSQISGNNYKYRQTEVHIEHALKSFFIGCKTFDAIIMTEPNIFKRNHLEILKRHSNYLVATLWDSLRKSPDNGENLDMFDYVFSYDRIDCENTNLIKINNYLDPSWRPLCDYKDCKYDVFSIMSYTKERYKKVIDFLDRNPKCISNIFFYCDHERKVKKIKDGRVKVVRKLMLDNELAKNISESRAILDILQGDQSGLSFRVYESIGYQRKLLTTNTDIKSYDIYTPDNIKILDSSYKVDHSFFESPYHCLNDDIIEQYTLESWVKNIFNEIFD